MRLLLDTHAFLWFIMGDSKLSASARAAIADPANEKQLSIGSIWEIAIKVSLGKLTLVESFPDIDPARTLAQRLPNPAIEHRPRGSHLEHAIPSPRSFRQGTNRPGAGGNAGDRQRGHEF